MLNSLFFLLEAASGSGSGGSGGSGNSWPTLIMLVLVVVFFYFFLIRPQKKQEKEANNMRNSLEIGDEVVTIGGIIGQIVSIKGDTVTIVTSKDRNKIRFLKSAIREVTVKANEPAEEAAAKVEAELAEKNEAAPAKEEAPVLKDESDK